jgi:2-keto-4-pentenoate hydratase/2-oxohepta-3-ene-1,7-dioic acid hydratase in catechol pathway
VKLCRFELRSSPGEVRSGIVHGGKIYETDGANPIAVHGAEDIRPLTPIGTPPSIRFFRSNLPTPLSTLEEESAPPYFYGNPGALIGASQIVPQPDYTARLDYEPYIAVVLASPGKNIAVEEADDFVLGYTIVDMLVARDVERAEQAAGVGPGRSFDIAGAIGPVLTTPDELEDSVVDESKGRRYKLSVVTRLNGVERRRGDLAEQPWTFAQLISIASQAAPLKPGDVIALGPVAHGPSDEQTFLEPDDEIHIAVEKLGTLATKVAQPL